MCWEISFFWGEGVSRLLKFVDVPYVIFCNPDTPLHDMWHSPNEKILECPFVPWTLCSKHIIVMQVFQYQGFLAMCSCNCITFPKIVLLFLVQLLHVPDLTTALSLALQCLEDHNNVNITISGPLDHSYTTYMWHTFLCLRPPPSVPQGDVPKLPDGHPLHATDFVTNANLS